MRNLDRALIGAEAIADTKAKVDAGKIEAWKFGELGFALTESLIDEGKRVSVVWCYQGKQYHEFTRYFLRVAKANRIDVVKFETHLPAIHRLLRRYNPRPAANGFYEIEVASL